MAALTIPAMVKAGMLSRICSFSTLFFSSIVWSASLFFVSVECTYNACGITVAPMIPTIKSMLFEPIAGETKEWAISGMLRPVTSIS